MEPFVIMTTYKSKRHLYQISSIDLLIIDTKEPFLILMLSIIGISIQLYANESVAEHVGFAQVFIDLLNENDNRPIFSQTLYNISLLESTVTGTSLLRIQVSTHTHPPTHTIVLLDVIFYDCKPSIRSLPNWMTNKTRKPRSVGQN